MEQNSASERASAPNEGDEIIELITATPPNTTAEAAFAAGDTAVGCLTLPGYVW